MLFFNRTVSVGDVAAEVDEGHHGKPAAGIEVQQAELEFRIVVTDVDQTDLHAIFAGVVVKSDLNPVKFTLCHIDESKCSTFKFFTGVDSEQCILETVNLLSGTVTKGKFRSLHYAGTDGTGKSETDSDYTLIADSGRNIFEHSIIHIAVSQQSSGCQHKKCGCQHFQ